MTLKIDQRHNICSRLASILGSALIIGLMAACSSGSADMTERMPDPRVAFPIKVARDQVSVAIAVPEQGTQLSAQDQVRMKRFIRDFAIRGRTTVTVESKMRQRVQDVLVAHGFRASELVIISETSVAPPAAILSFTANVVQVPDCGNWAKSTAFNPGNSSDTNFGCSNRRNLGLIVADPGDLIESQPMSGRGAARQDSVIDSYNAGDPIGPASTGGDAQTVSGAFGGGG